MATLDEIEKLLDRKLAPIITRLDGLETRFDGLETRFDGLETRFDGLETRFNGLETRFNGLETRLNARLDTLQSTLDNVVAKQSNSLLSAYDRLQIVKRRNGQHPTDFPRNVAELLVAGNENLPNGERNQWNKAKSLALLREYGEDEGYESETANEYTHQSRARRKRVAQLIGVTEAQMNFAKLAL